MLLLAAGGIQLSRPAAAADQTVGEFRELGGERTGLVGGREGGHLLFSSEHRSRAFLAVSAVVLFVASLAPTQLRLAPGKACKKYGSYNSAWLGQCRASFFLLMVAVG